nr:transglycosylase domain-containing protein [Tomitella biformata]
MGSAVIGIGLIVAIIGAIGTFAVAYVMVDVPRPGEMSSNQVATIYAADGTTPIAKVVPPEGNRTEVSLGEVPEPVRNAVLAAEDRDFYSNPGFSVSGFARAARDNVLGRDSAGGGSTITQQYVKNVLVGSERSIWRKMRELVASTKMAREWSKNDILEAYLNTIYFGRGAYGIDSASKAYFGKPVQELDVSEGAMLAAMIQSPSLRDPANNLEGATNRWNYVLDGMVSAGTLDAATRATIEFPGFTPGAEAETDNLSVGPNGLIKNQVLKELTAANISEQQLNTGGLQITTTIDTQTQDATVRGVENNMSGEPDSLRAASVSVDPRTGAVRGYYGGSDGVGYDFAQAPLQSGSTFKVFGLAALLDEGKSLATEFDSSPLTVNGVSISNVGNESCGTCNIAEALKMSLNTSFYRLQLGLNNGAASVADMAHKAGIPKEIPGVAGTSLQNDNGEVSNGIILGEYLVRTLDMASAVGTFAASGIHHDPYFVQKVVTSDGSVLLDRGPDAGSQAMSAAVADNVTAAMAPIAGYSNGHNLASGRPSAAKTGTTQLGTTGANKDAWMVGYTPSLSTAVWVGSIDDGAPLVNFNGATVYGSGLPSDIWKSVMDGALDGTDVEKFPKPAAIGGQAGVPVYVPPVTTAPSRPTSTGTAPTTVTMPTLSDVEVLPGVTIPIPVMPPAATPVTPPAGGGGTPGGGTPGGGTPGGGAAGGGTGDGLAPGEN